MMRTRIKDILLFLALAIVAGIVSYLAIAWSHPTLPIALALPAAADPDNRPAYWLAECSHWPVKDGETVLGMRQLHSQLTQRVSLLLERAGRRYAVTGWRLGSIESGWHIYAMRGPKKFRDVLANYPAICRQVVSYLEAQSLPTTAKNWIKERSTCLGSATVGGKILTAWPCRWETDRAAEGFNVTSLSGVGPGIMAGGSLRAAAGLTED